MTEYIIGKATVRIHGNYDLENVKAATAQFLKKAESQRKRCQKSKQEENPHGKKESF